MSKIGDIQIIKEFKNNEKVYGVYSVMFNEKQEIFIRNENSIGAIQHYWGKPASKCVGEIREDVKQEFLKQLTEKI